MKKTIFLFVLLLVVISFSQMVEPAEESETTIILFYGQGCPHCSAAHEFLEEIQQNYLNLNIEEYEVYFDDDNRDLFNQLAQAYNTEIQGVPTIFINDKVIVGFSNSRAEEIEQEVTYCSTNHCEDPLNRVEEQNNGFIEKLTLPAVIGAAAVDAINPCAFAVLIILLTTILISGNKKRAFLAGIAFITAIYISYFLMGLGLYTAIHATGLTNTFYTVVAVLAILLGLFNLKDFFWYGKGFVMEVPLKWRPAMKKIIRNVTSIKGAFLIGFVVSIFLLPCTSGPYIVILGLLSEVATRSYAISLLLIYNLIFILPMVGITLAVYFGLTTTEKAEEWRQKRLKSLHLLAGLILIILGIFMFIAMNNGWI